MAEFHRKIELQSTEDLQYLVSNVRRAAHEKIDRDLPPIEGEDRMRRHVEELVDEYINNVFLTTSANISINGLDPTPELMKNVLSSTHTGALEIEEHEPFNTRLFERAKDLARQEEDLIEEIAALRRKVPGNVAEGVRKGYKEGIEADETVLRGLEERSGELGKEADLGVGKLERQEEVEGAWGRGVGGLEGVMERMPEVVARKERAELVEGHVLKGVKK